MVSVHGGGLKAPLLVWALAIAFLLLVTSLLIGSFTKPELPAYRVGPGTDGSYTLDASAGDRWQRVDFARNPLVASGSGGIPLRRNHVITAPPAGGLDPGVVAFDSTADAPPGGFAARAFGARPVNPAI